MFDKELNLFSLGVFIIFSILPVISSELEESNNKIDNSNTILQQTVLDTFDIAAYNNNHGSVNWAGNWSELGDDGLPSSGNVTITNNKLQMYFANNGASRAVDLSTATTAIFSFQISAFDNGNDIWIVEASSDNGSNYTTIQTFNPLGGPGAGDVVERNESVSYNLESYILD